MNRPVHDGELLALGGISENGCCLQWDEERTIQLKEPVHAMDLTTLFTYSVAER
jgi:hypothetical protein